MSSPVLTSINLSTGTFMTSVVGWRWTDGFRVSCGIDLKLPTLLPHIPESGRPACCSPPGDSTSAPVPAACPTVRTHTGIEPICAHGAVQGRSFFYRKRVWTRSVSVVNGRSLSKQTSSFMQRSSSFDFCVVVHCSPIVLCSCWSLDLLFLGSRDTAR